MHNTFIYNIVVGWGSNVGRVCWIGSSKYKCLQYKVQNREPIFQLDGNNMLINWGESGDILYKTASFVWQSNLVIHTHFLILGFSVCKEKIRHKQGISISSRHLQRAEVSYNWSQDLYNLTVNENNQLYKLQHVVSILSVCEFIKEML